MSEPDMVTREELETRMKALRADICGVVQDMFKLQMTTVHETLKDNIDAVRNVMTSNVRAHSELMQSLHDDVIADTERLKQLILRISGEQTPPPTEH